MKLNAILFDVGGTIAESEEIHRVSFNEAFKEFGLNWYWDEAIYRELVFIGGGKERIKHYITRAWPEMLKQKNLTKYIESVHKIKGQIYEEFLNDSQLKARPGIIRLLKELKNEKIRLAIVSDTTEENLINLFKKGLGINPIEWFEILAHGGCTIQKKPSPDIYLWTLERLKLPPESCLAIEDAPRGVDSAIDAGLKVLVTPSIYTLEEKFEKSSLLLSHLGEPEEPFNVIKGDAFGHSFVDLDLLKKIHGSN
jgi:beta-phosphoglucomutase-like phosphatase (HAD superfamily)